MKNKPSPSTIGAGPNFDDAIHELMSGYERNRNRAIEFKADVLKWEAETRATLEDTIKQLVEEKRVLKELNDTLRVSINLNDVQTTTRNETQAREILKLKRGCGWLRRKLQETDENLKRSEEMRFVTSPDLSF